MTLWQDFIVWSIVAAAIFIAARWSYRRMTNPRSACQECDKRDSCHKEGC